MRIRMPKILSRAISEPGIGSTLPSSAPRRSIIHRISLFGRHHVTVRDNGRTVRDITYPTREAASRGFQTERAQERI